MEIKDYKLSDIKPYEKNPRKNDEAVKYVANSIKEFGFKVPIVIDKDNVIVCGHTRFKAAKQLGLETVPCIMADDLTPAQIKAFRLADNKTAEKAEWDMNILDAELAEILDFNMEDFGFDMPEINPDDFSDEFELPEGEKPEIVTMTLTLHAQQKELIDYAISQAGECKETFGNTNKTGNGVYEVVRQWAELRKSN